VVALNKADVRAGALGARPAPLAAGAALVEPPLGGEAVWLSARTGQGLDDLIAALVRAGLGGAAAPVAGVAVNARHRAGLLAARAALADARGSAAAGMAADFVAIDVTAAIAALGEVTGDAIADEVIDEVFRSFCVGK
jgi:tRNA modification GTPase